jgi:hypothetical protein
MGKLPKTTVQDTTTLILDFEKSNFEQLLQHYQIWEYELPLYMISPKGEDYAKKHIWARSVTDNPYYLHSIKDETPKLYVAYKRGQLVKNIEQQSYLLPKILFNVNEPKNHHCLLKVLMSCYVYQENEFVSNNKFYLLVEPFSSKSKNDYLKVLKINPSLNHQKNIQHQKTGLYELELQDSATRLKKVTYSNRNKRQIPFDFTEMENEQIILKQLKLTDNIDNEYIIYEENTSNSFRTSIEFHNIQNIDKFEKSRNTLLDNFSKELVSFFKSLGLATRLKQLKLEKMVSTFSEDNLKFKDFDITVFDMRFNKVNSIKKIISNFNEFDPNIQFKEGNVISATKEENVLILMDYSVGDCEVNGVLHEFNEKDGYKITKKAGFKISQGFCLNINYFQDEAKKTKLSKEDFLTYDAEWKEGKFKNTDLERGLKICIQQLYLKSIAQKSIQFEIPKFEFLEDTVFIHCFSKRKGRKNARYEYICYANNQQIFFAKLDSEEARQVLQQYGINDKLSLVELWKKFNPSWAVFGSGDKYFILNKQGIIEIKELKERVLYASDIGDIIEHRTTEYEKSNFLIPLDNEYFNEKQVKDYNDYIELEVEDDVSFDELLRGGKDGRNRLDIFRILEIKKENKLAKILSFRGKKAGFLIAFQGVWFDNIKNQYFVGDKYGYKYKQTKGYQMRKIEILKGTFNKDYFFPLLNVDFVKHKNYTVLPYPFNLIKMYATMNNLEC